MSYSKTKIFNIALNNLGVSNSIQDNDEKNPKAILLNNFYDTARDTVLSSHDWSFANTYKNLSMPVMNSPNPNFEFAFNCPNDCIAPRAIICPYDKQEKKYELVTLDNTQKIILTQYSPCVLRYTRRVTNETLFSADFVQCLGFYLAGLASEVITGSMNKRQALLQDYSMFLRKAIRLDSSKTVRQDQDDKDFTDCRY